MVNFCGFNNCNLSCDFTFQFNLHPDFRGFGVLGDVCSREELALIATAIADLPERCRQVAVLRLLRGCDCGDIARELGISEQTVRVQLSRAMKKCTHYFRERGLSKEGKR